MPTMARNEELARVRIERICELIAGRFGGSNTAFALAIGKSPSQVGHWLSGLRNPNGDTCREIENRLELPRDWLDRSEREVAHSVSYQPETVPHKTWEELLETLTKKSGVWQLPPEFWLTLGDDAMAPSAPKGTKVKFTKGQEPRFGDAVLLVAADGTAHVRVYEQSLDRRFQAVPENPHYAPLYGDTPGLLVIAVLTGIETRWSQLAR